ncbi:MAG: hypothetical protein WCN98_16285, partial [Verrucomicrobiaceae bacterium]
MSSIAQQEKAALEWLYGTQLFGIKLGLESTQKLLGALDLPSTGTLLYRGQSLPDLPDPAAYRAREIGIIFQEPRLLPWLT